MKKYFMVIARYNDWRQDFFENNISPRNKEYCRIHGCEYIEIKNDVDLPLYRNNPTWWKFTIVRDMMNDGRLQDGDIITHFDADMAIVDPTKEYPHEKSFTYCIDSGNTHCMGNYSIKVNNWSRQLIENILSQERYDKLNDRQDPQQENDSEIQPFFHNLSHWQQFREQASWYSLAGIKRHSWESFWDLPNNGFHSDKTDWTMYSLEELEEHVDNVPTVWNVTELEGETDGKFNINKTKNPNDVIVRHFSGGQPWKIEWFERYKKMKVDNENIQ